MVFAAIRVLRGVKPHPHGFAALRGPSRTNTFCRMASCPFVLLCGKTSSAWLRVPSRPLADKYIPPHGFVHLRVLRGKALLRMASCIFVYFVVKKQVYRSKNTYTDNYIFCCHLSFPKLTTEFHRGTVKTPPRYRKNSTTVV